MNKENILRLVRESKKLLPNATIEQKERIIKMLESVKDKINSPKESNIGKNTDALALTESDYLQEK